MKLIQAILTLITIDIKINFNKGYTPVKINREERLTYLECDRLLSQLDRL